VPRGLTVMTGCTVPYSTDWADAMVFESYISKTTEAGVMIGEEGFTLLSGAAQVNTINLD